MSKQDGWVTVGDLKPDDMFETEDGALFTLAGALEPGHRWAVALNDHEDVSLPIHTPARPVTLVHVSPGLDPTLKGLLLHALATGETAPLCDRLLEGTADQDAARAIRANLLREIIRPDGRGMYTIEVTNDMIVAVAGPDALAYSTPPDLYAQWVGAGDSAIEY